MCLVRLIQSVVKNGDRIIINSELESWNYIVGIVFILNYDVSYELFFSV